VPEATVVCAAVSGTTDIPRFPRRPRLRVAFFEPAGGQMRPGEDPTEFAVRVLAEIRAVAPISAAGRRPKAIAAAPAEETAAPAGGAGDPAPPVAGRAPSQPAAPPTPPPR
jgi:1-acyl-sn-glycerol-3-phosphate acyltransferase